MAEADKLRAAATRYQEVQSRNSYKEFEAVVDSQQQLWSQLSENKQVQKEFDSLRPDARVYKRTGPVLLPQEFTEAKDNVNKRIEFIEAELKRVETQIKTLSSQRDALKDESQQPQQ